MITGKELADCALLSKWDKYTYDKLDCQAFVEEVIKSLGITKPDGSFYNWRGSNSMYRNFYSWRGSVDECIAKFGEIPVGAFVYIWQETGADLVGYYDDLGNCKHVGIYCGNDIVRDSTRSTKTGRNGVGTRSLKGFNKVSLFSAIDYFGTKSYNSNVDIINDIIIATENYLKYVRGKQNELSGSKDTTG